jgi:hypothetical protein
MVCLIDGGTMRTFVDVSQGAAEALDQGRPFPGPVNVRHRKGTLSLAALAVVGVARVSVGQAPPATSQTSSACSPPRATSSVPAGSHQRPLPHHRIKHFHRPSSAGLSLTYDRLGLPADPGLTILTYPAEPGSKSAEAFNLVGVAQQARADAPRVSLATAPARGCLKPGTRRPGPCVIWVSPDSVRPRRTLPASDSRHSIAWNACARQSRSAGSALPSGVVAQRRQVGA